MTDEEYIQTFKLVMDDGPRIKTPGVFIKEPPSKFDQNQHRMLQDQSQDERDDYLREILKYAVIKKKAV